MDEPDARSARMGRGGDAGASRSHYDSARYAAPTASYSATVRGYDTRYSHKSPPVPPRNSVEQQQAYITLENKVGWVAIGRSEYMRAAGSGDDDLVEVPAGTLVTVDPLCTFSAVRNSTLNAVSVDRPEVKCTVGVEELEEVDGEVRERLRPLKPDERLEMVVDAELRGMLLLVPGDAVGVVASPDDREPKAGTVRYVGPVAGLGDGHWYGVELDKADGKGNSDGRFGHKQYFRAPPCSSVFVTANSLIPVYHNRRESHEEEQEEAAEVEKLAALVDRNAIRAMRPQQPDRKYDRLEFSSTKGN